MFTNIFGKSYLKFANLFFKNSVIQINKDPNILNINSNKSTGDESKIFQGQENILQTQIKKNTIELENSKIEKIEIENFFSLKKFDHLRIKRKEEGSFSDSNSNLTNLNKILIKNRLKNRVCEWHISANDPREDRSASIQLKNLDGYFISVFDGHGGDFLAKFAKKELHKKFDEKISLLKFPQNISDLDTEKIIIDSIHYAFDNLEKEIYQIVKEKFRNGDSKLAFVGCCVLSIIVHNNLLITANLGDCKAVLFRRQRNLMDDYIDENPLHAQDIPGNNHYHRKISSYFPIKLSTTHNARKHAEQYKLRKKFRDKDIIIDTNFASYVKGRLQPTKSLGDMYLKHREFNDVNLLEIQFLKQAISVKDFDAPYIDHIPEIKSHLLTEDDQFVVLATDGLWELLSSKEVCEIIEENNDNKLNITDALRRAALSKAALKANINFEELLKLPKSLKRAFHDDISIMVVDLRNQLVI